MKKRLILILNGKGGVGKSFFAVNFVQYLKDHEISHAAFDSDDENSTLKRFHSEAQFIDAGQPTEIDKVTFALADSDIVVVDCRAASTRIFLNYFEETRLPDILEKLGARLTIACPVNHELDSIYQIQKLVNAIGGKVDFVIIRNEVHGEGFDLFDKSKLRQKLLNDLGAKEIRSDENAKMAGGRVAKEQIDRDGGQNERGFFLHGSATAEAVAGKFLRAD